MLGEADAERVPLEGVDAVQHAIELGGHVDLAGALRRVDAIGHDPPVLGPGAGRRERLGAELDAFASGYWELAPPERRAAWAELSRRGADAVRLRELETGLGVGVSALTDPIAESLAGLIRVLFVLPPRARAIRRNTLLRDHPDHVGHWRAALAVVEREAPALAALEPRLRTALTPDFPLAAFVAGTSAAPVPATGATVASRRAVPASSANGSWIGGAAVFGLFVLVKLLGNFGGSARAPSSTPVFPNAHYSSTQNTADLQRAVEEAQRVLNNKINKPIADRSSKTLNTTDPVYTPDEVAAFERYERENGAGESPNLPPGYNRWNAAGRQPGVPITKLPAGERPSFSFDSELIERCKGYDRGETPVKPKDYGYWVAAGKPPEPGTYTLIYTIP